MPVGTLTFTGPIGPARTITAKVFNNVKELHFRLEDEVLEVVQRSDNPQGNYITELDIAAVTVTTDVITATVHAFTVS